MNGMEWNEPKPFPSHTYSLIDTFNPHDCLFYCIKKRPILLKGHERSITVVKYNYDGDLLFTASKDHVPSMWRVEDGERIGTFNGHKGTIWDLDCDRFSNRVITASADA